jgi:hypothetical protein
MTQTARERIAAQNVADRLDSREVSHGGELEGYVLHERRSFVALTPVRCCRTCAWADASNVSYRAGVGLVYEAPASA